MKCFTHPDADAVASCKHCFKGVCTRCAKDSEVGVVCSQACEDEVRSVRSMLERSRKMYPLAAKAHMRSAIVLAAMAIVFIVFSRVSGHGFMSNYLLAFGVV